MMSLLKMMSDDAYVERQRRIAAVRRPVGLVLIFFSCLVGAYGIWVWVNHNPQDIIAGDPLAERSYEIGLTVGHIFTTGGLIVIGSIISGVSFIFGGRATRLLIEYHDGLKEGKNGDTP